MTTFAHCSRQAHQAARLTHSGARRIYTHLRGVRPLSVLLENRAGEVAMVAHKLAEAGVNLHAIYVLGVEGDLIELAVAVDNIKKAKKVLE
jgi:hypothetical protein